MKSDYISRSALKKKLTMLALNGSDRQQRAYAGCVNEVETAPDAQMWIDAKRALPETDGNVLVIVSGKYESLTFVDAVQLGAYDKDEGWIIEGYEAWTGADVSWWMPIPERPGEDK